MYLSFKFPLLYSSAGTILRIFLMKRLSSIKFEFIYWASYIAGIRNEKASARFSMWVFNVQRSTFMVDWEVFGIRSKVEQLIYGLSVVFFLSLFNSLFGQFQHLITLVGSIIIKIPIITGQSNKPTKSKVIAMNDKWESLL